jgi:PAS domain S-box-containing protein
MTAFHDELKTAIEHGQVVPYFQPVVELRTGRLLGFEVLSRWLHPERGLVYPVEFIEKAESNGLIGLLMESVVYQASVVASSWPTHLRLSANLSPIQLKEMETPYRLRDAVVRGGFSMDRLTIEITESALLGDLSLAQDVVRCLKQMGARLAIDDFGTGYSSLNHLRALPFDVLKVDASFVRSMTLKREDRKIVAAVIGLGHSLGLVTVAEGVEEQAQTDMLLCLGCHVGQGWLYGKAMPAEEATKLAMDASDFGGTEFPSPNIAADMAFHLEAFPSQKLAQLQALYDGAPAGICFLDLNLRYVSLNRRLAEINGAPVETHIGRTVAEVLPDVYEAIHPLLQEALHGDHTVSFEIEMRGRALLANYQSVRDEAGEVIGISVAILDITERKRIEVALRESEDHYRHAVELNPQVPWTADPDGMIIDVSPRWTLLTGLTKEESLGLGWLRAVHPDDLERLSTEWMSASQAGRPADTEYRILDRDGTWRWMRSRASPRRDERGEIIRWYGTLEDIADRKQAEESLRLIIAQQKAQL